jgi:hypothetical protein
MQDNLDTSREKCRSALGGIRSQISGVQNEHRKVGWNIVRREDIVQFWQEYVSWERTDVRRESM